MTPTERMRVAVATVIVVIWVGLVVVSVVDPTRPVPVGAQALMMIVAGYLFAPAIPGLRRRGEGDDA